MSQNQSIGNPVIFVISKKNKEMLPIKKIYKEIGVGLIIWALIGGAAIAVGLLWPSFYWLIIGAIILLMVLAYAIFPFIAQPDSEQVIGASIGCCGLALLVLVSLINLFFYGTRYISSDDSEQHQYMDCRRLSMSNQIKEVSRLEGFFHLCFYDCDVCKERREEQRKSQRTEDKIQEMEKEVDYLEEQINALRNGADIDEMDFGEDEDEYYVEDEIEPAHLR